MPGIVGNLIDKDWFPIAGVDLYAVRQARQKLIMKQNDLKNLMNVIEVKMSKYFEDLNKENKTEDDLNINQNNNNYLNKEEPIAIPVSEEKIQTNINIKKEPFITITEITEKSPAEEAGLKVNDNIITFDNVLYKGDTKNPLQNLAEIVKNKIGKDIPIDILRKNEDNILEVKHLTLRPHIWEGRGVLGCKLNLIMN